MKWGFQNSMKLRRLEIESFRGISKLDLAITDTTVLIGENNTGKTAVLDALRLALRAIKTRRGWAFEEYDFHLPTPNSEPSGSPPISIRLTFREDQPGEWAIEQVAKLNRAKILQIDGAGCSLVILKVGARFDVSARDFVQDWEFQNAQGAALTGLSDAALATLHSEVSYFYLSALRDASKQFDAKGPFWRPFLKESQLTPQKRAEIESKLSEVNELIISSHTSFSQVVSKLKAVHEVITVADGVNDIVSIDAVPGRLFDMLSKAAVSINTTTGAKIPIGRHGEGTQSLAVLTLFNAYLQAWNQGDPIVALEEPEAHLHPSAVRALWQLIEKIPGQKIISTHSGDLLSEVPPSAVVRLARVAGKLGAWPVASVSLTDSQTRHFGFHIRQARGELLFAKGWLLVEGQSEVTLLPEIARILGINLERAGVRCVPYRNSDIGLYLTLADGVGISWLALTDNDQQGQLDIQKARNALNGRVERRMLHVIPEDDLEQHLCTNGFGDVYENLLTLQTQRQVNVPKNDPAYWRQVTKAVRDHKIVAVQNVLQEIRRGRPVPRLLKRAVITAANLAKSR
jgi:putative ATP-dependent endonuclease of the OLD family